jgi:hypothetical protein
MILLGKILAARGRSSEASAGIEVEDKTACLYAALWEVALGFSGPR